MQILEPTKNSLRCALLIDDDAVCQFISRLIIERLGLVDTYVCHYNGETALQLLTQEWTLGLSFPDVIVLDLNMPVMDGFEFLEHLHERRELCFLLKRTLVLSSSSAAGDAARVSRLGVRWYLTKPLTSQAVSPILNTLMLERGNSGEREQ